MTSIGKVLVGDNYPVRVMGIINTSPESFYKESIKTSTKEIVETAIEMQNSEADIIDIGSMSTAPYLQTIISIEEEIKRMKQAINIVRKSCNLPISIDTPRSRVAKEAIAFGANAINDITGLKYDKEMADIVSKSNLPVIVGAYNRNKSLPKANLNKISGTIKLLKESITIAKSAGISNDNIIIDPSIGFFRVDGKNPFFTEMKDVPWYSRDIEVISKLNDIKKLSKPICISVSRKSYIGKLFKLDTKDRLIPSLVCEVMSTLNGANLIRTHNVRETVQALTMLRLLH
ncbi:MAG: putative dihydropteroate synthase [Nitrososphaeraceae archaeon]|nr:putative dihydropteroate synthase [Nitrososphaeraceae archaeon]MDF2770366.1 putative dihydropteroate synthase [Nitrososphaeraceae archaeon]